jgi:outer membrane protein assembly factor BamD
MSRNTPPTLGSIALLTLTLVGCGGSDRYQGLDAETLFRTAQTEFDEGSYGNAIDALERLTASFQSSERLPDGRFLLAEAYFQEEEYITARAEYQRFLDRYVGHPSSAAASLGMCKSLAELVPNPQRDQTFTRDAINTCGNVIIDYAGTAESTEAAQIRQSLRETMAEKEFLTANHYFRRKQYDPAIKYFEFVLDFYPETQFAPQALLGIYRANDAIGYEDLAEEASSRLMREYPDSDAAAELLENVSGL